MRSIKVFFTLIVLATTFAGLPAPADIFQDNIPQVTNPLLHEQLQFSFKKGFALACNPHHRMASWVMFPLNKDDLDTTPRFKRITGNYPADNLLDGPCVVGNDEFKEYTQAGYDRGHLADAESFSGNSQTNQEVAITSNLTPQELSFNRGIWAKLEAWQRDEARKEEHIFVYVGPILQHDLPALAPGISIPEKFFKIIIDLTPPVKAIAFIIDQKDRGDFKKHWLCAREVERQTGLDFGRHLLGADKDTIFSQCDITDW